MDRNPTSIQILIIQARSEISDALNEANRLCTFAAEKALELEELEKELAEMMR